jgi:organic hydroperoxide reductase OsmC/OhrA
MKGSVMEPPKKHKVFRYQNKVQWNGARRGLATAADKPEIGLASPPEFKGEAGRWTPEDLFVACVNACTLLTFIAFAAHEGLAFTAYESSAEGVLEFAAGGYQFTEVVLQPRITVKSQEDAELARAVLDSAHMACLVTRSIKSSVRILPEFLIV